MEIKGGSKKKDVKMVMKKNSRGSVTRACSKIRRYREDEEYREKVLEEQRRYGKDSYKRNREKRLAYYRELTKFANKRCKVCNKLLNYRTKSGLCRKHHPKWKKKK